jgi:excinuclease UvrABC helicase subunit UvrB
MNVLDIIEAHEKLEKEINKTKNHLLLYVMSDYVMSDKEKEIEAIKNKLNEQEKLQRKLFRCETEGAELQDIINQINN